MTDWTDARIEILREGVAGGLSYSQIAKRVGDGCTRCSAIGKASRMGLSQPGTPSKPGVVRLTRPAKPVFKLAGRGTVFTEAPARNPRVVIPFREEAAGLATILTLGPGMCKWPIGDTQDPAFSFCGCKAVEGRPYCANHVARAHQAIPVGRPKSANELARSLRRYV